MDSNIQQVWSCFLPWTEWRHIRRSLYDLHGGHFWSEIDSETRGVYKLGDKARSERWDIIRSWESMCPKARFSFRDFDGEELVAAAHIEEHICGACSCSWTIRKPRVAEDAA